MCQERNDQIYFLFVILIGPVIVLYYNLPNRYEYITITLLVAYLWATWHQSYLAAILLDLFWFPLNAVLWPFFQSGDIRLFPITKMEYDFRRRIKKLEGNNDRLGVASNKWSHWGVGFIVGFTSSVAASFFISHFL